MTGCIYLLNWFSWVSNRNGNKRHSDLIIYLQRNLKKWIEQKWRRQSVLFAIWWCFYSVFKWIMRWVRKSMIQLGKGKYDIYLVCDCCDLNPTWSKIVYIFKILYSLDSRPLPRWYDEAKVGIFLHWGVYSVPTYGSEWFLWNLLGERSAPTVDYMAKNFKPGFTYQEFAPQFTAEHFDANEWAKLFEESGAK